MLFLSLSRSKPSTTPGYRFVSRAVKRKELAGKGNKKLKAALAKFEQQQHSTSDAAMKQQKIRPSDEKRYLGESGPRHSFVNAIFWLGLFPLLGMGAIALVNEDMRKMISNASWSWQSSSSKANTTSEA
jgi:hypothetical protein